MAETYWISTFHADKKTAKGTYDERRSNTLDALNAVSDGWWAETTSFVMFGSDQSTDQLVAIIKKHIDPVCDVVLLGKTETRTLRHIGLDAFPDVLPSLVPFVKKV